MQTDKQAVIAQDEKTSLGQLNKKQRVAVWAGIVFILLTGLFPPWKYVHPGGESFSSERLAGYSFIVTGPSTDPAEMEGKFDTITEEDKIREKLTKSEIDALRQSKSELQSKLDSTLPRGSVTYGTSLPTNSATSIGETSSALTNTIKGIQHPTASPTTTPQYLSDIQNVQNIQTRIKTLEDEIAKKSEALPHISPYRFSVKLDVGRFLVQLLTIILVTIGLIWVMRD